MFKFRKKPIVISAVTARDIVEAPAPDCLPVWVELAKQRGELLIGDDGSITIRTLEGDMRGEPDDVIIRGVQGELYPCKPSIFAATYEPVLE